jgi:hypothetical protein
MISILRLPVLTFNCWSLDLKIKVNSSKIFLFFDLKMICFIKDRLLFNEKKIMFLQHRLIMTLDSHQITLLEFTQVGFRIPPY